MFEVDFSALFKSLAILLLIYFLYTRIFKIYYIVYRNSFQGIRIISGIFPLLLLKMHFRNGSHIWTLHAHWEDRYENDEVPQEHLSRDSYDC